MQLARAQEENSEAEAGKPLSLLPGHTAHFFRCLSQDRLRATRNEELLSEAASLASAAKLQADHIFHVNDSYSCLILIRVTVCRKNGEKMKEG